jgi:large subunit ribosomal protein L25
VPEITLTAEANRETGSRAAGRLRAAGKIPGVLYGHGSDPVPIAVEGRALRNALSGDAGLNALLNLDMGGRTQLAMAKDIQRHPVRGTVVHVDFLLVNRDEVVTADINVQLVGEAVEVNRADGMVMQELNLLTVHARPGDLPHSIEVNISDMQIGDAIRVDDLELPAGVTTDVEGETVIVIAQPPHLEAPAEGAEGAEGAAAAAPEGAAGGEAAGGGGEGGAGSAEPQAE